MPTNLNYSNALGKFQLLVWDVADEKLPMAENSIAAFYTFPRDKIPEQ